MYYNNNTVIYQNGRFVKAVDAGGNLYDQSLHYGFAAIEGLRAYPVGEGTQIFKVKEHYDRMQYSCEAIGIPYPYDNKEIIDLSYELLERNGFRDAYLRPVVTCTPNMSLSKGRESQLVILAWEWGAYMGDKLLRLKVSRFRRISPASFVVTAKISGHYVNSILATQEAKDAGYDEALLLDVDGYIAEGAGANFFYENNNILYTPQLGSILPGITRATVFELAEEVGIEVMEKQIRPSEVFGSDSAFFCGTAAEIIGIESLDDHLFEKPWEKSLGAVLQKKYRERVREIDDRDRSASKTKKSKNEKQEASY